MKSRSLLLLAAAMLLAMAAAAQITSQVNDDVKIVAGPEVRNQASNSVTLWWQTNNVAATDIKYGTDPNNMDKRAYERGGAREHTAELKDLQPGRTYYYQILTREGQVRHSGSFQFRDGAQASQGQMRQFEITNGPIIEYADNDSAIIAWSTNINASALVRYGTSRDNLNQEAKAPWGGTTHRVELRNLQPNNTYYFTVHSGQAQGTGAGITSQVWNFQTPAPGQQALRSQPAQTSSQAPYSGSNQRVKITNGPVVEMAGDTSAVIAWSTDLKSSSTVRYGESFLALNHTAEAPWGSTDHRVTITGLKPNTRYFFRVESAQATGTGTQASSRVASFQTVAPGAQAIRR